jgi:hypothetical protein
MTISGDLSGELQLLRPDEELIVGKWVLFRDRILGDPSEQRIGSLVSDVLEYLADHPEQGGWRRLYRDPGDGRLWELSRPRIEMTGGGPRALRVITPERALEVYGWSGTAVAESGAGT